MIGRPAVPAATRFFQYVGQRDDCWLWTGGTSRGYGMFWNGHARVKAHRWIYEHMRADIPDGLQIDHLCRQTKCVNPWHMEPVTPRVNVLRSENRAALGARRDNCLNGHPLTDGGTQRICRVCRRDADRRRYRARLLEEAS
ncbi:MAG: HNH endonuclease signature motif containing protein [Chloroflexota bacterium]